MGEASPIQVENPEQLIIAIKRATELYCQSIGDSEQKVRCNIPHNMLFCVWDNVRSHSVQKNSIFIDK